MGAGPIHAECPAVVMDTVGTCTKGQGQQPALMGLWLLGEQLAADRQVEAEIPQSEESPPPYGLLLKQPAEHTLQCGLNSLLSQKLLGLPPQHQSHGPSVPRLPRPAPSHQALQTACTHHPSLARSLPCSDCSTPTVLGEALRAPLCTVVPAPTLWSMLLFLYL